MREKAAAELEPEICLSSTDRRLGSLVWETSFLDVARSQNIVRD